MKKQKLILIFLLLITSLACFGQNRIDIKEIRTAILRSDVILLSNASQVTNKYVNDYTIEQFYTINKIDSIIKNKTQFKIGDKIKIQQYAEDYSASWSENMISASPSMGGIDVGDRYSDIFFLKKENGQYKLLVHVASIKWDDLVAYYLPIVNQIMEIGEISNLNKRYSKTLDFFLEHGEYPDENFIEFYTQKGIIQGGVMLTEEQQQRVKKDFLAGNANLRPFVDNETSQAYSFQRLKEIRKAPDSKYWEFYRELSNLCEFEDGTADFILQNQLTNTCSEIYEKASIMDYFIKKIEQERKLKSNPEK